MGSPWVLLLDGKRPPMEVGTPVRDTYVTISFSFLAPPSEVFSHFPSVSGRAGKVPSWVKKHGEKFSPFQCFVFF